MYSGRSRGENSLKLLPRICGKESVERNLSPNFSIYIKVQTIHTVLICFGTQQPQLQRLPTFKYTITNILQSLVCWCFKLLCSSLQQTHPRCLMVGECPLMAPLLQSCCCELLGMFVFRNVCVFGGRRVIWGHLVKRKDGRRKVGVVRRMRTTGEDIHDWYQVKKCDVGGDASTEPWGRGGAYREYSGVSRRGYAFVCSVAGLRLTFLSHVTFWCDFSALFHQYTAL